MDHGKQTKNQQENKLKNLEEKTANAVNEAAAGTHSCMFAFLLVLRAKPNYNNGWYSIGPKSHGRFLFAVPNMTA